MAVLIQEEFVNATEGYRFGSGPEVETFWETLGEAFRGLRAEYGRCMGRVFVDRTDGPPAAIGWVFQKRDRYEDTEETYLREVWVTARESEGED